MKNQLARWARRAAIPFLGLLLAACGGSGDGSGDSGSGSGSGSGGGTTPRTADLVQCPASVNGVQGSAVTVTCTRTDGTGNLTLSWSLLEPAGATLPASSSLAITFTPQQATTYRLRLTASDGVAGDSEEVRVLVQANTAPQVSCPASLNATARELASVSCTVSDPDPGQTLQYDWSVQSSPAAVALEKNGAQVSFVPPLGGQYTLQLQVSDGVATSPATATVTVQVAAPGPWRIMPLGDSITQGNLEHASYRVQLWQQLTTWGQGFDLVGSENANSSQNLDTPNDTSDDATIPAGFDPDHEGHWGARTDQFLADGDLNLPARLQGTALPDVVLLHLGTNDMLQGQTVSSTLDELRGVVAILRARNPAVRILLARLIPTAQNYWSELNGGIASLVAELCTPVSPVMLVDQESGFDGNVDTYDGIHPNDTGEGKMAQKWFAAIQTINAGNDS